MRHLLPALTTLSSLAGFVAVVFVVQAVLAHGGHGAVARSPEFLLWSALIAVTVVVYGLLFTWSLPLAAGWRRLIAVPVWQPLALYVALGSCVLVFLWVALAPAPYSQVNNAPITRGMLVLGLVAAAPTVLGLWLIYARLRLVAQLLAGETSVTRRADDLLADLLGCRQGMSSCLAFMSIIVSTALVDAGALRKALLSHGVTEKQFPAEAVLLYGAFFTLITLLIYVPAFLTWRSRALAFVDVLYPLPADARPSEGWTADRARLIQLLGTEAAVSKNVTSAFGILAPLGTSVLSVVIPGLN
jgi:hypothetical protein